MPLYCKLFRGRLAALYPRVRLYLVLSIENLFIAGLFSFTFTLSFTIVCQDNFCSEDDSEVHRNLKFNGWIKLREIAVAMNILENQRAVLHKA